MENKSEGVNIGKLQVKSFDGKKDESLLDKFEFIELPPEPPPVRPTTILNKLKTVRVKPRRARLSFDSRGKRKKTKKEIKKSTRPSLGPGGPITVQQIFRIDSINPFRNTEHAYRFWLRRARQTFPTFEEFIKHYNAINFITGEGLRQGFVVYREKYIKFVPSRTERMRNNLILSIQRALPSRNVRFPYYMRVGVNVPYARYVDAMRPPQYKVQHFEFGDMEAEYQFWEKFPQHLMNAVNEGFEIVCARAQLDFDKMKIFLKFSPQLKQGT